jgi:hypothetical protein
MKSAIAKQENHNYTYPDPIDPLEERPPNVTVFSQKNIDAEVMEDVEKGEAAPWITFRLPRSKGDRDAIADATQSVVQGGNEGTTLKARIAVGNRGVFELLCEDWWLTKEESMRPSGENFAKLDGWAANWVQACLVDIQRRAEPDFHEAADSTTADTATPSSSDSADDGPSES